MTLAFALLTPPLAAETLNLTPRPLQATLGKDSLKLTEGFKVSYGELPDSLSEEASRFVGVVNETTGLNASAEASDDGLIKMSLNEEASDEGYSLSITSEDVSLSARTSAGFFYGFQSLLKLLPPNVLAGVMGDEGTVYELPVVSVEDEPRFGYRGFMLDVSRHFFTVDEVKRMIDLMATYKMNRFHWHLTDDQGWRAEIKQYPLLTTVGATASNCRVTDMTYGSYWTNAQYGPLFYTQEEMREVVEYCRERHIEVIPEVDMPGHFVAAMAAYPEYSCRPNNPPSVWTTGGISYDVLNVGNPEAVQFIKNILGELCDIFPSPLFHIGGDECPTTYWESNSQCQALYNELGLTSYRALQSHYINEISAYLATKGKRAVLWNESISASGADIDVVKEYDPVIMCWSPCQSSASQAAGLGLQNIVTEYHSTTYSPAGGYYINRKQSADPGEPDGAGYGDDTVEGCYAYVPVPTSVDESLLPYYTGVQATFWCEWVANPEYLEYLALPRLMAVAEAGWTPQDEKDFDDFVARMAQDTVMLNLAGYNYGRHIFASLEDMVMPEADQWYTLETMATDAREGSCIELLSEDSPLISQYASNNAKAGRLWDNTMAVEGDDNYDYQLWQFVADSETGLYAMTCKAKPEGSVNPTPTATNNTGRWDYDETQKNYAFVLGEAGYGNGNIEGDHYYSIRSSQVTGWYMNASLSGQGYAINLWNDASDGKSGFWEFVSHKTADGEEESSFDQDLYDSLPKLADRDTIRIACSVEGFEDVYLSDERTDSYVKWSSELDNTTMWVAYDVTEMDSDYCQTAVLYNLGTKRYVSTPETSSTGNIGYPLTTATLYSKAPTVTFQYQPATGDYLILSGGKNFYPVSSTSSTNPGIISCGNTENSSGMAVRPQGAAWLWEVTSTAEDTEADAIQAPTVPSEGHKASGITYNLSGQRVSQPARGRGVYIVDGKKQLVR